MNLDRRRRCLRDAIAEYIHIPELIEILLEYARKLTNREKLTYILASQHGAIDFSQIYGRVDGILAALIWSTESANFSTMKYIFVVNSHKLHSSRVLYFDDLLPTGRGSTLITELVPDFPKKYDPWITTMYKNVMDQLYAKF
jgi:hypothetical protein